MLVYNSYLEPNMGIKKIIHLLLITEIDSVMTLYFTD